MNGLNLAQRAQSYNTTYAYLQPPNTPFTIVNGRNRTFIHSFWVMGGGTGKVSSFYGAYQAEYLTRMSTLFPDCIGRTQVLHLFSGSLPPSPNYTRVGQDPTGQYKSDLELDAHELSSFLPFKPRLIYADPPYSKEDSEHYENSMVNRAKVVTECGLVLQPGGFLVWMDQALPTFSNELFTWVGAIGYVRQTGNRFRMITLLERKGT